MYLRLSATPRSEETIPREAPARRVVYRRPLFSPANGRAVVWEGRGATARPREAKWSSGVATAFWVCMLYSVTKTFSKIYLDITITINTINTITTTITTINTTEEHYVRIGYTKADHQLPRSQVTTGS